MTDRLLDILQKISDLWFSVEQETWLRLTVGYLALFGTLLVASIVFGLIAAFAWHDGLWIEAILIASVLVAMVMTGLLGVMSCIADKEGNE